MTAQPLRSLPFFFARFATFLAFFLQTDFFPYLVVVVNRNASNVSLVAILSLARHLCSTVLYFLNLF
jgi:hypothetical protein